VHGHGHSHCDHGHHHDDGSPVIPCSNEAAYHQPKRPVHHHSNKLLWVIVLTTLYMVIEIIGGLYTHSLALLGDAGHMFCDTAALALAWFASWMAQKPQDASKTYGYYRAEILAAFANGIILIVVSLAISLEAVQRLMTPEPIQGDVMMWVAMGGLFVNILAAIILHADSHHNLNVKAAWLHVMSDMLGSIGALVAGFLILNGATPQVDAAVSLFIVFLIVANAWRLLTHTIHILLEASPKHLDTDAIKQSLASVAHVLEVHDLHVWTITSGQDALSVHLVVESPNFTPHVLYDAHMRLQRDFGIRHATIQLEPPNFNLDEETHQH
jgi:cobalt-zinc-cadmium efflux system protein